VTEEGEDPWPLIVAQLDGAWDEAVTLFKASRHGFLHAAYARYQMGNKEYAGTPEDWKNWPLYRFENEAHQELVDLVLYIAMRRVRFGTGPDGEMIV